MIRAAAAVLGLLTIGAGAAKSPFDGRVAVASERCVSMIGNSRLVILDERTLLYQPVGRRIWRNDLVSQCPGLDPDDILIIEPFGSQLCENDQIRVLDRGSSIPGPICRLGKFTAFEKPNR